MRRGLPVVAASVAVLLVAACGTKSSQTSSTKSSQTSSTASGQGLVNAFNGNGSVSAVIDQQDKAALKAVRANPNNPAAWSMMIQALWTTAASGSNYNTSTASFTASGENKLSQTTQAWQHYLTLAKNPDPNLALLAARAYAALGNYAGAAGAWEIETASRPHQARGYECLAVSAYAAKENDKGDLALSKLLTLVPKAQRTALKTEIPLAKIQPVIAQQC